MSEWTPTEEAFVFKGESLGAMVFKVGYPEPGPNWFVLFPNGYVEPVDVCDPLTPRQRLPESDIQTFTKRHHPVRFVNDEATAAEYWRKRAHHFPGGARHDA